MSAAKSHKEASVLQHVGTVPPMDWKARYSPNPGAVLLFKTGRPLRPRVIPCVHFICAMMDTEGQLPDVKVNRRLPRRAVPVPCLPVETKSNGPLRPPKARQKAPFFRRSGEFSGPRCERKRVPKASRSESSRPDASDHVFHDENRPGDHSLDLLFALGLTLGEISSDRRRPFRSGTPIGASSSLHRD
jgi:hypothetical protein